MTKQELRSDLQDIRYYYIHKAMFDKAETTGFKSETLKKIERYGRLMTKAPPRLYVLYYLLYVEGKTQYAAALEQNVTEGHAYFMPLKEKSDIDTLADIFKNKIIPLLQEYFYDDYEKIRLVLGDNQKEGKEIPLFVIRKPILNNLLFGNTEEEFLSDNRYMYSINPDAFNKPGAYRFIYESDKTPDKESVKEEE